MALPGHRPFYTLKDIRELALKGDYQINADALRDAWWDFQWSEDDMIDAIDKLRPLHFHKSELSIKRSGTMLDFYKAPGLKGEDVYTHFYVKLNDGKPVLVINSFHQLT